MLRLPSRSIQLLSEKLFAMSPHVPSEINRKPRSLHKLPRYKATKLRSFLLYFAILAMKNIVDNSIYKRFLLLHCAVAILVSACNISNVGCKLANEFLITFIKHSEKLYGCEFLVHNVHMLSHIVVDVLNFDCLDEFWAFPFENFLGRLKSLVSTPRKPLVQICRRLHELNSTLQSVQLSKNNVSNVTYEKEHYSSPLLNIIYCNQYQQIKLPNKYQLTINSYRKSSCFCYTEHEIIEIHNIVVTNGIVIIIDKAFLSCSALYMYPFNSQFLKINKINNLYDCLQAWLLGQVKSKFP